MTDRIAQLTSALADRYAIERELGGGGMATVYLAEDRKHGRRVAVKVLEPEIAAAVGRERFLREIEIASTLRHPHILPLHDSGSADGQLYFVMPYVDGPSLRDRLEREGPLAVDEAVRITREVADALAYAHAHDVLHRDIKPENILLDSGHAVVADFGIALVTRGPDSERLTSTGLTPGTPLYMSPEQAGGEGRVDARTDVYSLGCVLYEMLIGEAPYTGSRAQVIVARKMFEAVPGMRVVRDAIPEWLEAVTRKALARSPADRFQTPAELAEALAEGPRTLGGATLTTPKPGVDRSIPRGDADRGLLASVTRSPWTLAAGVLGLTALLTLIGFLNVRVVDYKLSVPASLSPSRTDFPVVGLRAVVPFAIYVTLGFLVYEVAKALWHGLRAAVRSVPRVGRNLTTWSEGASRHGRALWRGMDPAVVAELFLVAAVGSGIVLLAAFWPLVETMWWIDPERDELLACAHRELHRDFRTYTSLGIALLGVAWVRVFGDLRGRGGGGRTVTLARWGSGAWILFLFVFTAMPWQLLYGSDAERALLLGERAYILAEDEAGLLVYRAERGTTARYPSGGPGDLRPLGVSGYPFEEPSVFDSGQPGCTAVTVPPD